MITVRIAPGLGHLLPLSRGEWRSALECMLSGLGLEEHGLDLALLPDAEMAELNMAFLGCHGPTNVLSFPTQNLDAALGASSRPILGELALAPQTVLREAFLYAQRPGRHALWLLAHGVSHLAGHEHGPIMDAVAEEAMKGAVKCLCWQG